jgi:hypothetical protein
MAWTTEKMPVASPTPAAIVATVSTVKARADRSPRKASLKS